jgi:hypothetical protein
LLSALLLQVFYGIRSKRQLMEQLDYNCIAGLSGLPRDGLVWDGRASRSTEIDWVLAGFEAKWPVLSFVVAGLELGIMHLLGEPQWLTAQYVKAKRSATVHNVMEQERKEAANVNIVVGPDRKRAAIAKEAEKSKFRLLP